MEQIKIGAGVVIWKDNKVLLGFRISAHGNGEWAFPGGHIEFGEDPGDGVIREAMEETGLRISSVVKLSFTNDFYQNGRQYITLFYQALEWSGTVENREPEKCREWVWFDPNALPTPLFNPIITFLTENKLAYIGNL